MRPLDGLLVVSVEQAVAAPFASRQLGDLGARVLKVERPGVGDFARGYDTTVRGLSSHFVWLNRNKESVCLDLKDAVDRRLLRDIVMRADVYIQNLAPGAGDRLGLAVSDLRADNPALVTCSISGYGGGGPYATRKAYDLMVQCEAGLLSVTGTQAEPSKAGISAADIAAGMYAYSGILAALVLRERTSAGSHVEISMLDALAEWMGYPFYYSTFGGTTPPRTGARHATIAPYGPFAAIDGTLVFLAVQNEREWHRLCEGVLGVPELAVDPRFGSNSARVIHQEELVGLLGDALRRRETDDIVGLLDAAGIANAIMRDVSELGQHPQLNARRRWGSVGSPVGDLPALLPPGVPDSAGARMDPIPSLGEHTERIRREFGGADLAHDLTGGPLP